MKCLQRNCCELSIVPNYPVDELTVVYCTILQGYLFYWSNVTIEIGRERVFESCFNIFILYT